MSSCYTKEVSQNIDKYSCAYNSMSSNKAKARKQDTKKEGHNHGAAVQCLPAHHCQVVHYCCPATSVDSRKGCL